MEDSFKVRVDKVFGSLLTSLPTKPTSPWTLSDAEIERKEWNRDKGGVSPDREEAPCSSAFDGFFSSEKKKTKNGGNPNSSRSIGKELEDDFEDFDGDDDEEEEGEKDRSAGKEEDYEREDWEIRNSIGLDSTLDHEDEEDEYDKVAVGRESAGDRVYMRDIADYGPDLNCYNILPESFEEVKTAGRDPRANHLAARARLEEDKETAGSFNSLQAHDDEMPAAIDSQAKASEDGGNVKSILKRKNNQVDSKSKKRVRFDPGCKDDCDKESEQAHDFSMVTHSMETTVTVAEASDALPENDSRVPDYIRNPSKYVCYTFDSSSEDDDESNLRAYKNFCNTIANMSACVQLENSVSLPKSVTFTPRRKAGGAIAMNDCSEVKQSHEDASMEAVRRVVYPVSVAAAEAQESEACAMEEDDLETSRVEKSIALRKSDRQYRSKVSSDDSIS